MKMRGFQAYAPKRCTRDATPAGLNEVKPFSMEKRLLDELGERVRELLRNSPAQDVERNLRALLPAFFDRMDLATREDLERQRTLLAEARAKLAALEARVAELEGRGGRRGG